MEPRPAQGGRRLSQDIPVLLGETAGLALHNPQFLLISNCEVFHVL